MRDLKEVAYLYPGHTLLREIEERDIEIAKRDRQLAGATKRADRYKAQLQAIVSAAKQRRQGVPA